MAKSIIDFIPTVQTSFFLSTILEITHTHTQCGILIAIGTLQKAYSALPPFMIFQYHYYSYTTDFHYHHFHLLYHSHFSFFVFLQGDRFIPNRSLMNLHQANSLLTNITKKIQNPNFNVCLFLNLANFQCLRVNSCSNNLG